MLKKHLKFFAVILLACMLFSGCNNGVSGDGENEGKNKDGEYVADFGGILNIACFTPDTLNPLNTSYLNVSDMLFFVYEGLFTANEDLSVTPRLAKSFTVSTSNKIYTVKLKENVKFHDGTDFTSEDVIATFDYLKQYETNYSHCISQILSYTAQDAYTINIELINPQPDFMAVMDFPVLSSGLDGASFEKPNNTFIPNGTGRFKFSHSNQMRGLTLVRNDKYYDDKKTYIDQIDVEYLDDADAIYNSFNSGEIDMITTSDLTWGEFSFSADVKSFETASGNYTYIGVNHKIPFLAEKDNRKAISDAINKKELTEAVVFKHGYSADTPVVATSHYTEGIINDTKPDESVPAKFDESVYLLYNEESDEKRRVAEFVEKSLEKIGIKVICVSVDFETYLEKIKTEDYQLYVGEVKMANNMNMDFMFDEVLKTEQNLCNYSSEEFSSLITNFNIGAKGAEGTAINYLNLIKYFKEYVPHIPLYHKTKALYINSRIKGSIEPNMSSYYTDAGDFYISYKK